MEPRGSSPVLPGEPPTTRTFGLIPTDPAARQDFGLTHTRIGGGMEAA